MDLLLLKSKHEDDKMGDDTSVLAEW